MKQGSSKGKYLRTVLREDIYERLEDFAKSLSTGQGHWDFGVAIERLMDNQDIFVSLCDLNMRVTALESKPPEEKKEQEKEKETVSLLGGHKIKI